jgi:hypothetical protein
VEWNEKAVIDVKYSMKSQGAQRDRKDAKIGWAVREGICI